MTRRSKRKHRRKGGQGPDEAFAAGPFEFARYGRVIVGRSRLNEDEWAAAQARLAAHHPTLEAEIDELVQRIAERVAGLEPSQLLHRAFGAFFLSRLKAGSAGAQTFEEGDALRMVDYVQSVITSVPPRLPYAKTIDDETWAALLADVSKLFRKLTLERPMTVTAWRRAQDPGLDMALEDFRVRTELLWANVRGVRYQTEERTALAEILEPHSAILTELFGMDAAQLAAEAEKVQGALTAGFAKAFDDFAAFRAKTLTRFEEMIAKGETPDPNEVVANDPELAQEARDVLGRCMGLDLFDVRKTSALPDNLIQALSYAPGEEETFFAPGEHRGWPLRVWPTMRRPFIRVEDRVFCFDRYALFDNLYRALQRIVLQLAPHYREAWNRGQQQVSEDLPFRYLERLLPGARFVRSIYYRWAPAGGRAEWHEADGLVAYDDHLLLLEIKAGAFTWTSPATDLPAQLRSLTTLVEAPAAQSRRFLDYLEATPDAALFDADHNEIGRLRLSDFRRVTRCTVTLDPFTESAARAQHLRSIGVDVGSGPVWVLSLDDLRVCAEIFTDPLRFLHFVEQRGEAAQSDLVDLDDETDHIGMYLKENHYGRLARDLAAAGRGRPQFTGYREVVDGYFAAKALGEPEPPPIQPLPERVAEIAAWLSECGRPGRTRISSFLLDGAGGERDRLHRRIEEDLAAQRAGRRSLAISSFGDQAFTMQVWSPRQPRDADLIYQHTQAVAAAAKEQSRLLLELVYDHEDRLADVQWRHVGNENLNDAQRAELHAEAEALKRRRVAAARADRWIRPNTQCPCGSGLKFKDCHLVRET